MHDWDEAERVRERVAHRLHDGPIQELTAAQLFLDGLALRLEEEQGDPVVRQSLERGLAALREATSGCRRIMESLRPGLDGEGELAERLLRAASELAPGAVAIVDLPPGLGRETPDVALSLYRVVEDLLDDAKARGAKVAELRVVADGARLELTVTAAGTFDPHTAAFVAAAARLAALGGSLTIADDARRVSGVLARWAGSAADSTPDAEVP